VRAACGTVGPVTHFSEPARRHAQTRKNIGINGYSGASRCSPWRPASRRAGALPAAVAGVALLAAGCGSGSSAAAGSKSYQQSLAFVQCMRTNGAPAFPDPARNGTVNASQLNVSSAQVLSAFSTCGHLLPGGVQIQLTSAQQQQLLKRAVKHAACMRAHGITNFPDPTLTNNHPGGPLAGTGINRNSPFFLDAQQACQRFALGGRR